MPKWLILAGKIILLALLLVYAFHIVDYIWDNPRSTQWDLMVYYYAAKAHSENLDPYYLHSLEETSGEKLRLTFVYHPATLPFFKILNLLEYDTAHYTWLILKLIFLAALIIIWRKYFLRDTSFLLLLALVLLAYDATVYWDLKAGNISIFEQLLLWLAFVFFLKRKPLLFCILVLAASYFKFTPLIFLILLPISDLKHKWRYSAASLGIFLLFIAATYLSSPALFRDFITSFNAIAERGTDYNYSMLAFLKDFSENVFPFKHVPFQYVISGLLYGLVIIAVGMISAKAIVRASHTREPLRSLLILFIVCVTSVVILPRMKSYSFIILIPPSLFIMRYYLSQNVNIFVFLLLILPWATPLPDSQLIDTFSRYNPLFMAVMIWIMYIVYTGRLVRKPNQ